MHYITVHTGEGEAGAAEEILLECFDDLGENAGVEDKLN